jgi:hypothetical protein
MFIFHFLSTDLKTEIYKGCEKNIFTEERAVKGTIKQITSKREKEFHCGMNIKFHGGKSRR